MRTILAVLMLTAMVQVTRADDEATDAGSTSVNTAGTTNAAANDGDGTGASCLTALDGTVDCL